jgi:hypothetical protein
MFDNHDEDSSGYVEIHVRIHWPDAILPLAESHAVQEHLSQRVMSVIETYHAPGEILFDHCLSVKFAIISSDQEAVEDRLVRLLNHLREEFGVRYELIFKDGAREAHGSEPY